MAIRRQTLIETVQIMGMEAQDKVEDKIAEAKGNVNALRENYRLASEKAKGKASSELLKAQMDIEAAKSALAEKKDEHDKTKLEEYIEDVIDYALTCAALSELAAEEARLATPEAIAAHVAYDEKFS